MFSAVYNSVCMFADALTSFTNILLLYVCRELFICACMSACVCVCEREFACVIAVTNEVFMGTFKTWTSVVYV